MKILLLALSCLSALFSLFFLLNGVDDSVQITSFELMAAGFSVLVSSVLFVGFVICGTVERCSQELVSKTIDIQNEVQAARFPERRKSHRAMRTELMLKEDPVETPARRNETRDFSGPQVAIYVVIGLMVALAVAYAATYSDLFATGTVG